MKLLTFITLTWHHLDDRSRDALPLPGLRSGSCLARGGDSRLQLGLGEADPVAAALAPGARSGSGDEPTAPFLPGWTRAPEARNAAISAALNPSSLSTWALCSPWRAVSCPSAATTWSAKCHGRPGILISPPDRSDTVRTAFHSRAQSLSANSLVLRTRPVAIFASSS